MYNLGGSNMGVIKTDLVSRNMKIKTVNTNSYSGSAIGEVCINNTDNCIKIWNGNGWRDITANSDTLTNTLNENFGILERYFKPIVFKENVCNYDTALNKDEFLSLVKGHIKLKTDIDCECSFYKNMLVETLSININNTNVIQLTNNDLLSTELFLTYNDKFYINLDRFLDSINKTIFSKLLNV